MTQTATLIKELGTLSYFGVFGISLIANILFIVPEEAVLLGLGYAARAGNVNIFIIILIVIAGLLISDLVLYSLSRGNSKIITFLYNHVFAKRLRFISKRTGGDPDWIKTHVTKIIFFSRFMIQLRFLGPFFAGRHKVPRRKFIEFELAALLIYVPLLIWAGWFFQNKIESIISGIDMVKNVIIVVLGIIVLVSVGRFVYNKVIKATA